MYFRDGNHDFDYLKRHAPLIAYELERQGIVDKIKVVMKD